MTELERFERLIGDVKTMAAKDPRKLSPIAEMMQREIDGVASKLLRGVYIASDLSTVVRAIADAHKSGMSPDALAVELEAILKLEREMIADKERGQ